MFRAVMAGGAFNVNLFSYEKDPLGNPFVTFQLIVQSTFMVQLTQQVNSVCVSVTTVSGPQMLTFHGSTTEGKTFSRQYMNRVLCLWILTAEWIAPAQNSRLLSKHSLTPVESSIRGQQWVQVKSSALPHVHHFLPIFVPNHRLRWV